MTIATTNRTPTADASKPSATKLTSKTSRQKRRRAKQRPPSNDEDDDDDQTAEAPWHSLPPAPNKVQGMQMQKALYPTQKDIEYKEAKSKGKKDAFSIVLEINLEVEITLKARIHGDLTLALLS